MDAQAGPAAGGASGIGHWPVRAGIAVLLLGILSLVIARLGGQAPWPSRLAPPAAFTHDEAARRQQGVPTTAAEARAAIEHDLAIAQGRAAGSGEWSDHAAVGDLLLARARLTGSFADYAAAGRAYDAAFTRAAPGTGPHLERAGWNFAVHRLAAVAPDLAAVEHYAVPDDAMVAAAIGLRGDVAFYRGQYAKALTLYTQAQARMPTLAGDMRLANYYARMGDPDRALALIDQAETRMTGPQQQLRGYFVLRRGLIALARGRWDEAHALFVRADAIFPGYWLVEEQLATVRALQGAPAEAMAIFRRMAARAGSPNASR